MRPFTYERVRTPSEAAAAARPHFPGEERPPAPAPARVRVPEAVDDGVTGLLGPLLCEPDVELVKGFYHRPEADGVGGGRVTELVAKAFSGKK